MLKHKTGVMSTKSWTKIMLSCAREKACLIRRSNSPAAPRGPQADDICARPDDSYLPNKEVTYKYTAYILQFTHVRAFQVSAVFGLNRIGCEQDSVAAGLMFRPGLTLSLLKSDRQLLCHLQEIDN